ncbi:MAG: glycosyltransferase family 39 protein [Alphaproteobacteria bacterium]|nr:MAG: glycosyltransferase family 39 protein [Alphaproteobacteria bacterium]
MASLIWTSPGRRAIGCRPDRANRVLAMPAKTEGGGRAFARVKRLLDALADPSRRERTVVVVLLGYVALWTLYGAIAKASQDIHADMSEQFALGRELALGYPKHPPLAMLVVRAWFSVFPTADWAYYLLAMVNVALALWIAWRLSARFLDGEKRAVGLALLTLVPFFNFHGLKFNVNTILLPLWAATTLWFLRSFETRRPVDAALAGLFAAAAMYGKYWSIFLLLGLGVAALSDSRRAAYFRSPAPGVTIAVGALALAPHVAWLIANDFAPFSYAMVLHGAGSLASTLADSVGYLAGSAAYVALPLVIVFTTARPSRAAVKDMAWPGLDRPTGRPAVGLALVHVGFHAVAGHAAILAGRCARAPRGCRRAHACARLSLDHAGGRAGDCVAEPSRRSGACVRACLGPGGADRTAVARDDRPATAHCQRL